MKDLRNDAERNLDELQRALAFIDKMLANAPEGRLDIVSKGCRQYYLHNLIGAKGIRRRIYLSEKDAKLINSLANKNYYCRIRPLIIREINSLEKFLASYYPSKKDAVYIDMCSERQKLIIPIFTNVAYELQKWIEEGASEFTNYNDSKRFATDNGELVRSKSELMIANRLAKHSNELLYKYEPALTLRNGRTVHPDFKILSLVSGKKSWLEHAGMMDNPEYAENFVKKMRDYQDSGINYGENLFVTMETSQVPLTTATIDKTINRLL